MKPLTNRKWDGILSLVWACVGFLVLTLGKYHLESPVVWFFVVVVAWWVVAMLLAVSGLRSRFTPSVLSGLGTVLLFVCLVCYLLIGIYPLGRGPRRAPIAEAMTQIATFKVALDAFRADTGFYPTGSNGLQELVQRPAAVTNWRGPYLQSEAVLKDPWGHDYIYEYPGRHNTNSYDISSQGPPRQHAPISNWANPGLKP
jgi:general secretion pathway protein G